MFSEKSILMPKKPFGNLNFGGLDYADLTGADMSRAKGIQDVKVLGLSKTFGWRGRWNFKNISKVFLCYADLSKVNHMYGAKVMSFYGATGLPKVIDLTETDDAYFDNADFTAVQEVVCNFNTKLHGLDSCKNWRGKIKYAASKTMLTQEDALVLIKKILNGNLR